MSVLDGEEQMVLSVKLDAQSTGLGIEGSQSFDPPECDEQNLEADSARIGLVEGGSGVAAIVDNERTYIVLVSETNMDIPRIADAHNGPCSEYTVTSASTTGTSSRTVSTEQLDVPPALASDDAVVLLEVSVPDNPEWTPDEVLLGFATVDDYTVMVLGYQGAETEAEFGDIFTAAVERVQQLS